MKHYTKKARQAGMTLIELTVVLLVLIGLAGLMIPYVSGFVSKTHDSTGSSNAARANQSILQYEAQFFKAPNNLESLINGVAGTVAATDTVCTTALATNIYCKMMATGFYTPLTLTADHVASLNAASITQVLDNNPDTTDATFQSVNTAPRTFIATEFLAGVSATPSAGITTVADHLVEAFGGQQSDYDNTDGTVDGVDGCFDYVAFGIGDANSMIGRTMQSAPIHFANTADMGATNKYNRFVAVYKVDASNVAPCSGAGTMMREKAKFIGVAMSMASMSGHLWGVGASTAHAWSNLAAENNN
ncbi:MAG: type II secretion system protein [Methylococcales bacterium]|nr:type II secretion system protein [Methylococcales bacterium]